MIDNFGVEYICGEKFKNISDKAFDIGSDLNVDTLKNYDIIWCVRDYVEHLFHKIRNHTNRYILITHSSGNNNTNNDSYIDERLFNNRPKCICKWFAHNINYKHNDLISLPIGLENPGGNSNLYKGGRPDYNYLCNTINPQQKQEKITTTLYGNYSVCTNRITRGEITRIVREKCPYFFTDASGDTGPFIDYCESMRKFLFIISPPGHGMDCFRTWEALYFDSIPIVQKHLMFDSYTLPIIQIENWNHISMEWIQEQYKKLTFSYKMLNISYWFNLIKESKEKISL
jgi:hypothetical protein